jgi:hypothetical protein
MKNRQGICLLLILTVSGCVLLIGTFICRNPGAPFPSGELSEIIEKLSKKSERSPGVNELKKSLSALEAEVQKLSSLLDTIMERYYTSEEIDALLKQMNADISRLQAGVAELERRLAEVSGAVPNMYNPPVDFQKENLKILDIVLEYDVDAVYFGDDWGQQHGLITGPKLWREFFRPRLAKMYDAAKKNGKFLIQHSCGDIEELFPDLIDLGLDCYQTFQPEIYDVAAVKKKYGANLSFWGGISTQQLLPCATPDEVRAETRRLMKILAVNGGYIAGPTHAVPGDVPPENILAMADVLQNQ